jgi:hypothetical protein
MEFWCAPSSSALHHAFAVVQAEDTYWVNKNTKISFKLFYGVYVSDIPINNSNEDYLIQNS